MGLQGESQHGCGHVGFIDARVGRDAPSLTLPAPAGEGIVGELIRD